jgi:hypothetical protein
MAGKRPESIWRIVAGQHGVVTRAQLRELGLTDSAIEHRLAFRFPRAQVIFEPNVVQETLMKVARRLRSASGQGPWSSGGVADRGGDDRRDCLRM